MKLLIQNFIKNLFLNSKNIYYVVVFMFLYFIFGDTTFADNSATTGGTNGQTSDANVVLSALNEVLKGVAIVLTMGTNLVGWFLSPDWTTGKLIGLDKPLYRIWVMVSNVVYYIFAFIFIWIAFMNIIGKGDGYEIKSAIPRFIVGVLIVPFSWFIVQFTLSVSNVLTAAVLSLPMSEEMKALNKDASEKPVEMCVGGWTITTGDNTKLGDENDPTVADANNKAAQDGGVKGTNYIIYCNKKGEKKLSEVFVGDGIYSIMYYYTYQVIKFDEIGRIFQGDVLEGVTSVVRAVFKLGFNMIFIIIYALLLLALIFVMFTRVVYLWMYTMLSPLFGLSYFFKKGGGDSFISKFNIKEFFSLAFLPVMVSAALVFGMIFIITATSQLSKAPQSGEKLVDGNCINIPKIVPGVDNKLCWDGVYHSETVTQRKDITKTNFGAFLVQLFGIMFLWLAVMAAFRTSKIVSEVARPFERIGKSVGEMIRKAPQNIPIIPTKGENGETKMMTIGGLNTSIGNIKTRIEGASTRSGRGFEKAMSKYIPQLNSELVKVRESLQDIQILNGQSQGKAIVDSFDDGYLKKALTDMAIRKEVIEGYGKIGIELKDSDFSSSNALATAISRKIGENNSSKGWNISPSDYNIGNIQQKIEGGNSSSSIKKDDSNTTTVKSTEKTVADNTLQQAGLIPQAGNKVVDNNGNTIINGPIVKVDDIKDYKTLYEKLQGSTNEIQKVLKGYMKEDDNDLVKKIIEEFEKQKPKT